MGVLLADLCGVTWVQCPQRLEEGTVWVLGIGLTFPWDGVPSTAGVGVILMPVLFSPSTRVLVSSAGTTTVLKEPALLRVLGSQWPCAVTLSAKHCCGTTTSSGVCTGVGCALAKLAGKDFSGSWKNESSS